MKDESDGRNAFEDDILSDLDLWAEGDGDEDISAAIAMLDVSLSDDTTVPNTVVVDPEWMADVRELARKHGPFSTAHIMKITPILLASHDRAPGFGQ
ncbi:hypothetical protein JQ600_02480 [Bradyrhizobium sp. AUGA SZCCT0176]|uniref:hypothetical protein n=1 Tax=Bradyrhizobium sp. AUGA SZCCT0176 TaxID=2807664 RepID=UPI001BACE9E2|nr:hypothetical protein [Bradyrhizobium sp. AUGA SZCCT0176]MBR1223764.1 hypothetical protein [Bradyrhizobium sp. AUGA SZCCT0176]